MNVWIVNHYAIPPSMGGLVRHYYFSKYLQKKGHTVKIFTSSKIHNTDINMIKDKSLYREEMEDGVEYTFVRSRDYKGNGIDRIVNMIDFPFKLLKALRTFYKRKRPDVIYASSPDLFVAFFSVLFGKWKKIPVVVEIRDLWPESVVAYNRMSSKNPIIHFLYHMEKWIYVHADQIVFTMEGGKQYICDKGWDKKVSLDKIIHINNGVDIEEFQYNKMHYPFRDEMLDGDAFKVVYVGSVRYANNLIDVVNAGKVLKKRSDQKIRILVYGDGTEKDALERISNDNHLNVFFRGPIEKKYIPSLLEQADLNLINVRSATINKYGCSWNKLFEYMASGKPILCNLPVKYDLIRKYNLGVARKFDSAEEYAEALQMFAALPRERYEEYCENIKSVVGNYDYANLANIIENVLLKTHRKGQR